VYVRLGWTRRPRDRGLRGLRVRRRGGEEQERVVSPRPHRRVGGGVEEARLPARRREAAVREEDLGCERIPLWPLLERLEGHAGTREPSEEAALPVVDRAGEECLL